MLIAYLFLKDRCDVEILCDCNTLINAKIAAYCGSPKERKSNIGKTKSVSKYSADIVSQAHCSLADNRNMALPSKSLIYRLQRTVNSHYFWFSLFPSYVGKSFPFSPLIRKMYWLFFCNNESILTFAFVVEWGSYFHYFLHSLVKF